MTSLDNSNLKHLNKLSISYNTDINAEEFLDIFINDYIRKLTLLKLVFNN